MAEKLNHEHDLHHIQSNQHLLGVVTGKGNKALNKLLDRDAQHDWSTETLDRNTFASLLQKCESANDLLQGKRIHDHIVKCGLGQEVFLGNLLVQMYGKCGALEEAREVFDNMKERNVYSWNIMIGVYARNRLLEEALQLFQKMPCPNIVSWNAIIVLYAQHGKVKQALQTFQLMPERNVISWTAMVTAYSQQGQLEEAYKFFQGMPERDVVSWNRMISAYAQHDQMKKALTLFQQMPQPNVVSWNTIIAGYAQQGDLFKAFHFFQQMPKKDVISWTTMLAAYAQYGHIDDAMQFFRQMPQKDTIAWNAMLAGYTQHGQLDKASDFFKEIPHKSVSSWNIMIDAYAQCGQLEAAVKLFQSMPQKNVISWTTMISAYVQHGQLDEAFELFRLMPWRNVISWTVMISACAQQGQLEAAVCLLEQMQLEGVTPDNVTFVSILDACAETTDLDEGRRMHSKIISYGIESQAMIQTALINMYAKCGNLEDADLVFKKMSKKDSFASAAMIAAYAQHGQGDKVLHVIRNMQRDGVVIDQVTYCSILSACSHAGLVHEGCYFFASISADHGLTPVLEHYNCIIDLLGRTEWLDEAEVFAKHMPYQPDAITWTSLLGTCRNYIDVERGIRIASYASELDPSHTAPYILLSQLYATSAYSSEAAKERKALKDTYLKRHSSLFIESENSGTIHRFVKTVLNLLRKRA